MARVEKSIDVKVPVYAAYGQWTRFEEFPRFMEGVRAVRQLDDRRLLWEAEVGGRDKVWEAEIREQVPNARIIWNSVEGNENAGIVTFEPIEDGAATRVNLAMSYRPEGFLETVGDALGFMARRVEGDLTRFRDFIEERGVESGGYLEEIHNPDVPGGHTRGAAAQTSIGTGER